MDTRVELLSRVGRSGSAELLRARLVGPAGFSRPILLKRLTEQQSREPRQVERLRTEALLTALVQHPHVLPVIGLVPLERGFGVAWADSRVTDLQRILEICATQRKRFAPHVALGIGWILAGALARAHTRSDERLGLAGIAHGDLSPSNVLVDEHGQVLLVDFGIGLPPVTGPETSPLARIGRLHGKPGYMSPEVVVRGVIGPLSDQFSLGTLVWEMLTLRRLFAGKDSAETLKNVAVAHIEDRFARHPEVPPFVQQILTRALSRAPEERFANMEEFQDALLAANPAGYFGIETELARVIEELAPIPPDVPIELDVGPLTARPRGRTRVTPRMILLVQDDDGRLAGGDPDEPEAWQEVETLETPEILSALDAAADASPLVLPRRTGEIPAAVVAPPPLPESVLEPPPLPPLR